MNTATGQLIFTIIGAIACFEREMMLERQREGIGKAKAERRCRGRSQPRELRPLRSRRWLSKGSERPKIAKRPGLGRGSVYRVLSA